MGLNNPWRTFAAFWLAPGRAGAYRLLLVAALLSAAAPAAKATLSSGDLAPPAGPSLAAEPREPRPPAQGDFRPGGGVLTAGAAGLVLIALGWAWWVKRSRKGRVREKWALPPGAAVAPSATGRRRGRNEKGNATPWPKTPAPCRGPRSVGGTAR
jgi:hypothetical protein